MQDESSEWFLQREHEEGESASGTGFARVNGRLVPRNFAMPLLRLGKNFTLAVGIARIWFLAKTIITYSKSIFDKGTGLK